MQFCRKALPSREQGCLNTPSPVPAEEQGSWGLPGWSTLLFCIKQQQFICFQFCCLGTLLSL